MAVAFTSTAFAQAGVESFETDLAGWKAAGGGAATISDAHWKHGVSLRWDFTPGSCLVRAEDESLQRSMTARDGGIKLWLYCERPMTGDLQVQLGKYAFPIHLGFTGWRTVWVVLREDARPAVPCDGLRITAPAVAGTLFLDAIELGDVTWCRQGGEQAPYVNASRAGDKFWFTAEDDAAVRPPPPGELTAEDTATLRELEKRYEMWMFGRVDDPRPPVRRRMKGVADYNVLIKDDKLRS